MPASTWAERSVRPREPNLLHHVPRARLPLGVLAAVVAIAVILIAPTAGALPVHPPVKHKAPFHGTVHLAQLSSLSGCGASASFPVAPAFNLTSGVGVLWGKSAVWGCGPPGFGDDSGTSGTTGFDTPVFPGPTPSAKNFSLNYTFVYYYNLSATVASPAGGPFAWAAYNLKAVAQLWDLTTASEAAGLTIYTAATTNGTLTGNVSHQITFAPVFSAYKPSNITTVGHHYIVQFFVQLQEWTHAPSGTATHASARVNMATGGNHMVVQWWTLSI